MICLIARYAVFSPEGSSVNINRAVLIIYMEMNGHSKKIASVLQTIFYICFNTSFTFARMKCYANHYFCTDLAIQRHYLHFRISAILCRPDRQIQTKVLSTNNLESPDRDAISLNCFGERERERDNSANNCVHHIDVRRSIKLMDDLFPSMPEHLTNKQ